jgi:hypothetical protein
MEPWQSERLGVVVLESRHRSGTRSWSAEALAVLISAAEHRLVSWATELLTSERTIRRGVLGALTGVPLFVTAPLYRRWHTRWSATDAEVSGPMPGAEIVPIQRLKGCDRESCRWYETTRFKVKALEPDRWLLWEGPGCTLSWEFCADRG